MNKIKFHINSMPNLSEKFKGLLLELYYKGVEDGKKDIVEQVRNLQQENTSLKLEIIELEMKC